MRETSSRSLMSRACSRAFRSMAFSASAVRAGESMPRSRIRTQPSIAVSGVRSSCERMARKVSFERFAASAAARARSLSS